MQSKSDEHRTSVLDALFQSAIDGIIIIDELGTIEAINPAGASLFGYEPSEAVGHNVRILMPSPHQGQHDAYIENYRRTGQAKIIGIGREEQGQRKDGTCFPMRLAVSEARAEGRRIFVGTVHDLSKQKLAEEKIVQLNKELEVRVAERTDELARAVEKLLEFNQRLQREVAERRKAEAALRKSELEVRKALAKERELNELKSRFVSMASHEFRTPLSTILSSVSLIGRYTEAAAQPQREKHIARIKSAVENLNGILDDFLSLGRIEEGKVTVTLGSFSLGEFCREVAAEIRPLLKNGQRLEFLLPTGDVEMNTDKRLLKNIFFNIIGNAAKYSEAGKAVTVTCTEENGNLHIVFKDEGMGIPEADKQYIFERFFRATNSVNIQGTGLGLNIVKRYVELLGGRISFESELGKGSVFRLVM